MGFIFQSFNLIDTLNVKDNILLPLTAEKVSLEEMDKRSLHVTSILGTQEFLSAYSPEISVGRKQWVAAARALIANPKIISADESTGLLDLKSATELLKYLAGISLHDDVTISVVTHDLYTASFYNRILFIRGGVVFSEVVRQRSRKEFFNRAMDMQAMTGGSRRANDF